MKRSTKKTVTTLERQYAESDSSSDGDNDEIASGTVAHAAAVKSYKPHKCPKEKKHKHDHCKRKPHDHCRPKRPCKPEKPCEPKRDFYIRDERRCPCLPLVLPGGTDIPTGTILPAGTTILPGTQLPVDVILADTITLPTNTYLLANATLLAGSVLASGTTLTTSTTNSLPITLTGPTTIAAGSNLSEGTILGTGAIVPGPGSASLLNSVEISTQAVTPIQFTVGQVLPAGTEIAASTLNFSFSVNTATAYPGVIILPSTTTAIGAGTVFSENVPLTGALAFPLNFSTTVPITLASGSFLPAGFIWPGDQPLPVPITLTQPLTLTNGFLWDGSNLSVPFTVTTTVIIGDPLTVSAYDMATGNVVINVPFGTATYTVPAGTYFGGDTSIRTSLTTVDFFPAGTTLATPVTAIESFTIYPGTTIADPTTGETITFPTGSALEVGNQLIPNTTYPLTADTLFSGGNTLPVGFTIPAGITLNQPIALPTGGAFVLSPSTVIVPPFTVFPTGTVFAAGTDLPAGVPLPPIMLTTPQAIPPNSILGSGTILPVGTSFDEPFLLTSATQTYGLLGQTTFVLPPGSVLPAGTLFPPGQVLPGQSVLTSSTNTVTTPLTLAAGSVIAAGSLLTAATIIGGTTTLTDTTTIPPPGPLYAGTIVEAGSTLPAGTFVGTAVTLATQSIVFKTVILTGAIILPQFPILPFCPCEEFCARPTFCPETGPFGTDTCGFGPRPLL